MKKLFLVLILLILTDIVFGIEQLIQIAVEVVEVDVNKTYEFGIKWIDTIHAQENSIPTIFSVGDIVRLSQIYGDLKLLMDKGAADLLANPKLVTKNNTIATFNAGGEIPYIASTSQQVNVIFKTYGVKLEIKPSITSDNYINVELTTEVSSPDESLAITLSGNTVPAILNRSIKSELNIKPGSTITIGGLNQTRKETIKSGIPILGSIPILGALFSRHKIVDRKTSIVIFVTPTIL